MNELVSDKHLKYQNELRVFKHMKTVNGLHNEAT